MSEKPSFFSELKRRNVFEIDNFFAELKIGLDQ